MQDPRERELDAALTAQGPLSQETATALIERGRERLDQGDLEPAARDFQRVVGHVDLDLAGQAALGLGDALYRMDREDDARVAWEAATQMPDNVATYRAWRAVAGARVRANDLRGAMAAYREADRRAPHEDKAEIAARLGWLSKETGNAGAAGRYFARSRGTPTLTLSNLVLFGTIAISLLVMFDSTGQLGSALLLNQSTIRHGELYRLLSVTLVHDGFLHLFFNMYALYLIGPIVEGTWGSKVFLAFYVLTALGASTASFLFGPGDAPRVGASGAIFGLVGVLLAGTRVHHPMLDRRARAIAGQLGFLVLINLAFGFLAGSRIDNAAHIGGLISGLWLGLIVPPGKVPTLRSAWQHPRGEASARSPLLIAAGVVLLLALILLGLAWGGARIVV